MNEKCIIQECIEIINFNRISHWRSELSMLVSLKYLEKDWQYLMESCWDGGKS